jgi:hypothetical protein
MSGVEIIIHVTGHGWANLEFNIADRRFVAEGISNTSDAIGDLLRSAIMIATGAPNAAISFDREPTEWRLVLRSLLDVATGLGPVQIRLLEFPDVYAAQADAEGTEVFKADCPALDFSRAVLEMANRASDLASFNGGDFSAAFRSLKAALEDCE